MKGINPLDLEKDAKLKIFDEGKTYQCTVLFTFECDELGKSYVAYTKDDEEQKDTLFGNIYIASYEPDKAFTVLEPVKDENELQMAHDIIDYMMEEMLEVED